MPTSTDLVTDLPADFEVFGQAVDTDFVDLLGGANGYILSKASATDLDFAWIPNDQGDITAVNVTSPITGGGSAGAVTIGINAATTSVVGAVQLSDSTSTTSSVLAATPTAVKAAYDKASTAATTSVAGIVQLSDSTSTTSSVLASTPTATKSAYDLADAAIAKSTVTTAGDIIYRNATVPVRLGIGTAGQVLKVNSGATAPEWVTSPSGSMTKITTGTFTTVANTSTTFDGVFTSTYKKYLIVTNNLIASSNPLTIDIQLRAGAVTKAANYYGAITRTGYLGTSTIVAANNAASCQISQGSTTYPTGLTMYFTNVGNSSQKAVFYGNGMSGNDNAATFMGFHQDTADTYTGFILSVASGTISGVVTVYGLEN